MADARSPAPADPRVREATRGDIQAIAAAVRALLVELGRAAPEQQALERAASALLEDPSAGVLLLAQAGDGEIVGFLGASFGTAVRIPGRYATIEELWVHPSWRGKAIGSDLLCALVELVAERGLGRIEVGLPSERFEGIEATRAFYRANGFQEVGTRMRRMPK